MGKTEQQPQHQQHKLERGLFNHIFRNNFSLHFLYFRKILDFLVLNGGFMNRAISRTHKRKIERCDNRGEKNHITNDFFLRSLGRWVHAIRGLVYGLNRMDSGQTIVAVG